MPAAGHIGYLAVIALCACAGPRASTTDSQVLENVVASEPTPTAPVAKPEKPASPAADITVVWTDETMTINGQVISQTPVVEDFQKIFGLADRTEDLYNNIHVYEKLGIILYERGDDQVIAITFFFQVEDLSYMPKEMFTGTLTLTEFDIAADTSMLDLESNTNVTVNSTFGGYDFTARDFSIIITPFEEDEDRLSSLEVSFAGY